ncbi:MAG TPA: hypothetical protein VN920_09510 [Pyrinomonadaceae bacterium]|nr:hypothetical protein [Pyrinomonadaceae bacterium]
MSNQSKPYSFHLADQPSELSLQARTQFLESVLRLKPQVVADLWDTAFPEFKRAVIRRFAKEILDGIEDIEAYFDEKRKKHLQDLQDRNSHHFHLLHRKLEEATGARPYSAFELLSERPELKEKVNEVIQHYLAAFENGLVVKLIQSKLTTDFGDNPIRLEFHFYAEIAHRAEDQTLATAIQEWSEKWNLNADWCRDHAVAVLREWLSHRQLDSVGLHTSKQAMQRTGWASATHELLYASIMSRISADTAVYGMAALKPLKFEWGNDRFERDRFNRLRESQTAYKQQSLVEFELWLSEKRRPMLLELLHSDEERPVRKVEPYYEVLKRFKKVLNKHIIETLKATDKSVSRLIKTKRKRALSHHIRWAVEFHVPPHKTLAEIVKCEDYVVQVAEVLRVANPGGLTREEIVREFLDYSHVTGEDIDYALTVLFERRIIHTEHEDPTSRVIQALRDEGRDELFGPDRSPEDEQKALAVIRQRVDADYAETGGVVIVRYFCKADKNIREAPDPSVVSKAAKDILKLVGLEEKRTRAKTTGTS